MLQSIATMASIPLLCKICPKHPDFSDISHLLTHVSSKGHLAHLHKAQVRSGQEPAIRGQLDAYNQWYDQHHIERLLSQRMVLKASKINLSSRRIASGNQASNIVKPAQASKRQGNTEGAIQQHRFPGKAENVIDPQLSRAQPLLSRLPAAGETLFVTPQYPDLPSRHRAHVPTMRASSEGSPLRYKNGSAGSETLRHKPSKGRVTDTPSESDREQPVFPSPRKTIYPDPSDIAGQPPFILSHSLSDIVKQDIEENDQDLGLEEYVPAPDDESSTQSPRLKGVYWPGMSIFDSAKPEAQRKRNQRKDISVLQQMEFNSIVVEPVEQIFWPGGTLKKQRLITGNVESSPLKDESPKLKRRRSKVGKSALTNASTNNPRKSKIPRVCKSSVESGDSLPADLGDLSKRAFAMLDSSPSAYRRIARPRFDHVDDEHLELELTIGDPTLGRKRPFVIYDDKTIGDESQQFEKLQESDSTTGDYALLQQQLGHRASIQSHSFSNPNPALRFSTSGNYPVSHYMSYGSASSTARNLSHHIQAPSNTLCSRATVNNENVEPVLDYTGRIDAELGQAHIERSTQRYFSRTGGRPAEFFGTLPPQMEFGGMSGPRFPGSSLNPLNPNSQQHQVQPYFHDYSLSAPLSTPTISPHRMRATSGPYRSENDEQFFGAMYCPSDGKASHRQHERI